MKVVSLWSGGKDSCLACHKAIKTGYEVISLLNFTETPGNKSLSHNLSAEMIMKQGERADIELLQYEMPKGEYRNRFIKLISGWREEKGVEGIIFGDIYLQEHKDWIDAICQEIGVRSIMPIWGIDTKELIEEFVRDGFKAVVVAVRDNSLGKEWLGREIDDQFIKEIEGKGNIDLCGEKGEFHTFVYDAPLFNAPVEFRFGKESFDNGHSFLEVLPDIVGAFQEPSRYAKID